MAVLEAPAGANGRPDAFTVALARLMRQAIVVSGTTKAAAISAVVSPPSPQRERDGGVGTEGAVAAQAERKPRVVPVRCRFERATGPRRGQDLARRARSRRS